MSELLNLPKGHAILQSSTVELPLQKIKLRIHKIYDSVKNKDYGLCYDAKHRKIGFEQLVKKEQALYDKKYGKLHPSLYSLIRSEKKPRKILVAVWLSIGVDEPLKTNLTAKELGGHTPPKKVLEARLRIVSQTKSLAGKIASETKLKVLKQSKSAPVFYVEATVEQIQAIGRYKEVGMVARHDPKGIDDLQDSLDISEAQEAVYDDGNKGKDIRVAVWEQGPDVVTNLVVEDRFDSTPSTSAHARLTHAIIKNQEANKPNGYAPECLLYSANSYDTDALEWAVVDQSCRVISQSFHRSDEETEGSLSSDDILKDYLVLRFPYPTIIQAAGNTSSDDEYVNHKGYNSIAVGNHNDDATAMSGTTTWRNPTSRHDDRELPEICANGTSVTAAGSTNSGTSFAAPAVAGASAVLMRVSTILMSWPEGIRAILLASAKINVRGNNWQGDLISAQDARDGAGALNLKEAVFISKQRKSPGNTAAHRGFDVGTFDSVNFKPDGFARAEYKIRVPRKNKLTKTSVTHVKVALTWDAKVLKIFGLRIASILHVDLDLKIYRGSTLVAQSSSWDNSYEIAEFDANPGDELTIKIRRYSGTDWTYYGLAWTVF